jgi:L-alanine-DL-glutamate epimerase-like enolase superfamily enzyme
VVGERLPALFSTEGGATDLGLPLDMPLWDLVARRAGQPVYALAAAMAGRTVPDTWSARCYDTSLYFDDLHLPDDDAAGALMASEALEGWRRGHRNFKVKVGRGARHMSLEAGTRRDIAVVRAVRKAVGLEGVLMIDANDGYNLNLAKRVLLETAGCHLHWIEEPMHEDPVLYGDLKAWLEAEGLSVLIADGEGRAAPQLLDWVEQGLIDVVQFDILTHGFTRWLATAHGLEQLGIRIAPHHYGLHLGNFVAAHLAAACPHFAFVEWDQTSTEGIGDSGYVLESGTIQVPGKPGFGLDLDEERFARAVRDTGFGVP